MPALIPIGWPACLLVDPIGDGKQIPADRVRLFLQALESDYDNVIQEYWTGIAGPNSRGPGAAARRSRRHFAGGRRCSCFASVMQFDPRPLLGRLSRPDPVAWSPPRTMQGSACTGWAGISSSGRDGTGHWIQLDKPDEFNRMLDEFLKTA